MQKRTITITVVVAAFALSLSACLPSSQKKNTNELTPGDSLSRQIASEVQVDSLEMVSVVYGTEESPMELPTSLLWLPDSLDGEIFVVDTRRGSLHVIDRDAGYLEEWLPEGLEFPYAAGIRGDTLVLLNRGQDRLDFVREGEIVRSLPLPEEGLSTALVTDSTIFVKRSDEKAIRLLRLTESGAIDASYNLPGPYWRHIGFLRAWGNSVWSLSGYRPVVDFLTSDAPDGTATDSLTLLGFDSPQLVRSNQYLLGEVDEPPLLISSGASFESGFFLLNLRADGLRIDVYDVEGQLERVLAYTDVEAMPNAFPVDLAIHRDGDALLFALAMQNPGGLFSNAIGYVVVLRWRTPIA